MPTSTRLSRPAPRLAARRVSVAAALLTLLGLLGTTPADAVVIGPTLTANDDTAAVVKNGTVWISLFDNDVAPSTDPLSIYTQSSPAHGIIAHSSSAQGLLEYRPAADFTGTDTFTYSFMHSSSATPSNLATVTVTVTPSNNTRPSGTLDSVTATSGVATDLDLLANDSDADGDAITLYEISQAPAHGAAVVKDAASGVVTYTPDSGYSGSDLFRYVVQDTQGALSNQVAVVVTVGSPTFSGTPPTVTGTAAVGQTLTAEPGSYTPADNVTVEYQWFRDAEAIPGATAEDYPIIAADAGRYLRVRATATRNGETVALESDSVAVAPLLLTAPVVAGSATVGHAVTASTGTWAGANGYSFEIQWLRDGASIDGATGAAYTLTTSDAGHWVGVRVAGSRADSRAVTATSAVVAVPAVNLSRPTVRGTLRVGKRLRASAGAWAAPGHTLRYRWLRDGKPIAHATKSRYRLRPKDRGHRVSVRVIAARPGFATVTAVSVKELVRR